MEYNINITNLRKELYKVNESILDTGLVVNVSSKNGDVVMMSREEYESLMETLYLSSDERVKNKIIEGMNSSSDDCVSEEQVKW